MALTCNIDPLGRTMRMLVGAMIEAPGLTLLVLRYTGVLAGNWPWFVGATAVIVGVFMIVEGAIGWCAIRAMGLKTPI